MTFSINEMKSQLALGGARSSLFQVTITNPVNIISDGNKELAALIYYDKYVALVLFEYCYLLFSLSKGKIIKGLASYSDEFTLDKESIDKIKSLIKE